MTIWIKLHLDAYEVIDVKTKKIITTLQDETSMAVHSGKVLEIRLERNKAVQKGDQFGLGRIQ